MILNTTLQYMTNDLSHFSRELTLYTLNTLVGSVY